MASEPTQTDVSALESPYRTHRRFDRAARLFTEPGLERLMSSRVLVFGMGGVGSFAAEALARSGVGELALIDFDEICITNVNRQLHAMQGVIGKYKSDILADRFSKINPKAEITAINKFYNYEHADEILDHKPDYVIDAIDSVTSKAHLLNQCQQRGIKVICSAGAGGRMDPTMVRVADLGKTTFDPLARMIRKILRTKYGHPKGQPFDIPTVFSTEPVREPVELAYDGGKGFRCVCPQGDNEYFTCDNRNLILGTAGFVTGTFGFTCASVVVRHITEDLDWSC